MDQGNNGTREKGIKGQSKLYLVKILGSNVRTCEMDLRVLRGASLFLRANPSNSGQSRDEVSKGSKEQGIKEQNCNTEIVISPERAC
jgi:hypothetical protein